MASTSTQPEPAVAPPPKIPSVSNRHRWIDLGLVLAVAFAGSILGSVYLAFHPAPPKYTNIRVVGGILAETIALALFLVLFTRQGRSLKSIGFAFSWTDLPKALGLAMAAFVAMTVARASMNHFWVLLRARGPQWPETHDMFSATSRFLLLPFVLLNPFFEEILVRGYLVTELIDLRKSVVLATLISLALQTSYHLYYGVAGALTVGCGLTIFAIYYAMSGRLIPVILAHMLWDLTALLDTWHR